MVGQPVEQGCGHLGVAEHAGPLGKRQIGGDDHRSTLVEAADQVEQHLPARTREGQVAQLVQDHEVRARQLRGQAPRLAGPRLGLELIDQNNRVEEARPRRALTHAVRPDGDGQVRLARARAPDQHRVAAFGEEGSWKRKPKRAGAPRPQGEGQTSAQSMLL